jgi:hypothetical protein
VILAALFSPLLALAIFCDSLRAPKRRDVLAERQAASARLFDGPRAAKTAVVIIVTAWSLVVIAAIHLLAGSTSWLPLELS